MSDLNMIHCQICGKEYQYGPQRYDGKYIRSYDLNACQSCYAGNRDGWGQRQEKVLLKHIEKKGIAIPERNEKGLIPRD